MTALRQQAFEMLESVPEENLLEIIQYIQVKNLAAISKAENKKNFLFQNDANKIQSAIDNIKGILFSMSETDKNKSMKDWHEERLREKYAEYFN